MSLDLSEFKKKMDSAIDVVKREFVGLRTGRASTNMLDHILVEAYGSQVPLNTVGAVSVPEARLLAVTVWDNSQIKAVEKAIRESNLGLNPMTDGNTIRVPLPSLTAERRTELAKVAGKHAEAGKIAIRNVRRDAMDFVKKQEKDKKIAEDAVKGENDKIQKLTDEHIKLVDDLLAAKEVEIKQV